MSKKFVLNLSLFLLFVLVYLVITLNNIKLEYKYRDACKRKEIVNKRHQELLIEYSSLNSPAYIEEYAIKKLGLTKPKENQFRYISD